MVAPILDSLVDEEPVIALRGPRSVGKSTLLHSLAASRGVEVVDLDDPAVREAAAASPGLAVAGPNLVCIDEYQHVPALLDALKAKLNANGSAPGTAVFTGSTRQDAIPRGAQALTGRLHSMTIWPLSQGELDLSHEGLLTGLQADPDSFVAARNHSTTTRAEYVERVCAGGLPLAVRRTGPARDRWFDDYVNQSIERDAAELAQIHQRQLLRTLLDWFAGRTGQLSMASKAADALRANRNTIESYTRLLEDLFLIERLPAWGTTLRARTDVDAKGARCRLRPGCPADAGLGSRLVRLDATAQSEFGNLLETFVVGELRKQASWLDDRATLGHWRTHDKDEVDVVLELGDGRVIGFEVKAAERVSGLDFRGLRKLRDALGDRFVAGVVFNLGTRSIHLRKDRLHVLPVDRLWSTPTSYFDLK